MIGISRQSPGNMGGLSAGVAATPPSGFRCGGGERVVLRAVLSLGLVGCGAEFVRHGRFPARIDTGEAGNLYHGFVLSVPALHLRSYSRLQVTFLMSVMVLAVAIMYTPLVIVARLLQRRSPLGRP